MIPLQRKRKATSIKAKYRGADKHDIDLKLLKARRDALNMLKPKIEWDTNFWKLAKTQLKKESNGKCAYCEANTDIVAYGDVEHFRPKSIYWSLAYTYDNYLYVCQICNQKYKSDNFPINGSLFPMPPVLGSSRNHELEALKGQISPDPIEINLRYTLQQYLDNHVNEKALLLNPYFDDPTGIIAYEFDDVKEEVKVIPVVPGASKYIEAMEDYYGINRVELLQCRYMFFSVFRALKLALQYLPVEAQPQVKREVEKMKSDKYIFAGMNRYFDTIL